MIKLGAFFKKERENSLQKFIAHCEEDNEVHLMEKYKADQDVIILIGPEGDFSPIEIKNSFENGYAPISLGASRLRTETAAMVACHTVNLMGSVKWNIVYENAICLILIAIKEGKKHSNHLEVNY